MANGYIGKISALVTASTADLSRKLNGSTRDVDRFARSVNSQIAGASASARKSLEGIFTPLQRIQRAFDAGRALNLIDDAQVRRFQQVVSIAEQINKPLGAASRAFQGLSADVAAGLLPALLRAQDGAQRVNDEIGTTGGVTASSYRVAEQAINRAAAAFERFRQAEQIIGSAPRGQELQFNDPQLFAALQASAEARRGAAAPGVASRVGSGLGDAVREVARFDELVAQAAARVNGIRLAPQVDTSQLERAQGEYQDLIVQQRQAVERLNRLSVDPSVGARAEQERRIAAANTFLQVDQRESQLTSLAGLASTRDASGRTIQERVAAINSLNQQAQAEASLRAEQEARLAVANSLLQVDQRESQLTSLRGQATALPAGFSEGRGRDRVRGRTGSLNLDSTPPPSGGFSEQATRDIDALATRVGAVRQQLETLPNSIRTRFIPELQRAQAQLVRLQNSPAATVQAIENATQRVQRLEAAARRASAAFDFRQSFGGAGLRGIEEGLNQQALGGYTAQLQLLQQTLAGTSQAARGPAVAAFDRLRTAIATAMENGTLETEQTRRVIRQLTQEAARATAAAAGIGSRGLERRLQRVGDVGRGSFGNLGLGIQQAIFAFDDFFSVTGGLDQRIRAAGNNISQLGFIVGGTAGLVGGVLVAALAQGLVALIKWQNQGVETADTQKALNEALARQKSIVEGLAEAYRAVADAIADSGFSQGEKDVRRRRELAREARRQQDEQLRERVAASEPVVQRERGIQAARQRELEETISPAERLRQQQEIRDSQRREAAAIRDAQLSPGVTAEEAAFVLGRPGVSAAAEAQLPGLTPEQRSSEARRGFPTAPSVAARQEEARARREELLGRLDQARNPAEQRRLAVEAIEEEQQRIRDTITTGVLGAFDPANDARRRAIEELEQLRVQLEKGFQAETNRIVASALESAIEVADQIGRAQQTLADAIGSGASETANSLDRANQSLLDAQERLSRAQKAGDEEGASAVREEIEAIRSGIAAYEAAANSVAAFAAVLDRVSNQLADTVAGEARGRADQARREDNRQRGLAEAGLGFPGDADAAQRQRERAEADARAAEDRRDRVRRQNDVRRELFERDAIAGQAGGEAQQAIRDRDDAQRRLDEAERAGDVAGANNARRDRDRAQGRLDRAFEASPSGRAAAARADELDRQEAARREREDSIARGRELGRTPAEKAGRDLAQGLRDLESAFDDNFEGIVDRNAGNPRAARAEFDALQADFEKDRRRLIEDAQRSAAPAIFDLADQVANAVIQGPSRAALQATDVSTVEGSSELNRLLRGDDSARDQNLVELQKQSQALDELVRIAREGGADIAN
jgi:hypothetical protein